MTEYDAESQLAALRAATDQAREAGREVANMIATYFASLLENGMERGEALELTVSYQAAVLESILQTPAGNGDGSDED